MKNSIEESFAYQLKSLSESMQKWNSSKSYYAHIVDKLEALDIEPSFSSSYVYAGFSGDKAKLTEVVRALRASGFKSTDARPKKGDATYSAWFRRIDGEVTSSVYLSFTSSVCQRVQVGTKMEEVPVYEVRCS